jgi:hypothetical protein
VAPHNWRGACGYAEQVGVRCGCSTQFETGALRCALGLCCVHGSMPMLICYGRCCCCVSQVGRSIGLFSRSLLQQGLAMQVGGWGWCRSMMAREVLAPQTACRRITPPDA